MTEAASVATLTRFIRGAAPPEASEAFERDLQQVGADPTEGKLLSCFATATRRLGSGPLIAERPASLRGETDEVPLQAFSVDLAARAALLLRVAEVLPGELERRVWAVYRQGDTQEKIAVVRSLALLPDPARFTDLSLDAGRTNETKLFAAVACHNPFPARHYPELEFNKLYMKAAFVRVPLDQILGVEQRRNAELSRMAADYVNEQEAATRSFPPEIFIAISHFPPPGSVGKMLGYASHAADHMRLGAVRALASARDRRAVTFLEERLQVERDERVRAALTAAISACTE